MMKPPHESSGGFHFRSCCRQCSLIRIANTLDNSIISPCSKPGVKNLIRDIQGDLVTVSFQGFVIEGQELNERSIIAFRQGECL